MYHKYHGAGFSFCLNVWSWELLAFTQIMLSFGFLPSIEHRLLCQSFGAWITKNTVRCQPNFSLIRWPKCKSPPAEKLLPLIFTLIIIPILLLISLNGDPVTKSYNPSYLGDWEVWGQVWQTIKETIYQPKSVYSNLGFLSQTTLETEIRKIMVPGQYGQQEKNSPWYSISAEKCWAW
jgi:hypothetical protein